MNKMAGIILMTVGLITFGVGLYFFISKPSTPKQAIAAQPLAKENKASTTNAKADNKRKGDEFEKFIVLKFNKHYFTLKNWTSDKSAADVFPEANQHPDLHFELKLNNENFEFAVECKWRQNLYKGGVDFATEAQLQRYKQYEQNQKIPVFVAIGIGGLAEAPEHLYVVPLREIHTNFITIKDLEKHERKTDQKFFYDPKTQILK